MRDFGVLLVARGELAGDQRDAEHHGEGHQILRIADGEGEARRHEEEVEGGNRHEGCRHRRAAPETHGDDEHRKQEQHGDVGSSMTPASGVASSVATRRRPRP